jgi:hypothetical protein
MIGIALSLRFTVEKGPCRSAQHSPLYRESIRLGRNLIEFRFIISVQTISLQASPGDILFGFSWELTFVMIILVCGLPGDQCEIHVADIVNDAILFAPACLILCRYHYKPSVYRSGAHPPGDVFTIN